MLKSRTFCLFRNFFFLRFLAIFVSLSLFCSTLLIGETGRAKAESLTRTPTAAAPISALPEIFQAETRPVGSVPLLAYVTHSLPVVFLPVVTNFFSTPSIPEGFENAKPLNISDKLVASTLSFLNFLAPKRVAAEIAPPPAPNGSVEFDFDGDDKADIGRWQSGTTEFKVKNSGSGAFSTHTIGSSSSILAPADYDNDGKTDAAVFSAGTWTIKRSSDGTTTTVTGFGQSGDVPVSGNYTGTAAADLAYFRPSNNTWYYREVSNTTVYSYQFGAANDIAVPGNYDADSFMDFAVFRPSNGYWYVQGSTAGYSTFNWGLGTDIPVPADYDGDGKTDYAVYRSSTGYWWIYRSQTASYISQAWGNYGDQPTPADYDGDGKADISVWRPTTGVWHTIKSLTSTYDYQTLGVPGDKAVTSAYIKQIGGTVTGYDLAQARLSPKNATGGTNLYSRNFSWGTSLVGLPGRAGLDAGFGMSYNSLVWTKSGSEIHFDTNADNISPGFRFGFPTIEPVYYNSTTQKFNYLMVTPSGGRVEFRQTTVSNIYETADSSYVQLQTIGATNPNDPVEEIKINVTGTDGTLMTYEWKAGAFRCSGIKDRNGNYITINHDEQGLLRTITDTLSRIITVNYDTQLYPTSITQTWKDNNGQGSNVTHTWTSFAYTTKEITTNFNGLTVIGPPNGTILRVLERVTYADGSSTRFTHNSYGQVFKVQNYAADNHELNRVRTDLETPAANQTDCPKFGQTISYVENFNSGNETTVTNTLATSHQITDIDGATVTASLIQVAMQNHPTGNITNTYVHQSGWREGLPVRVDDYSNESGLVLRRSSWTKWTQDDPNASYIVNPRVKETKVSDGTNTKKTSIEYLPVSTGSPIALYGLVKKVEILDGASNVLKRVETDYNLASAYTSRRILGLPGETRAWGKNDQTQNLEFVSKMTYLYDEGTFSQEPNQIITPIQHDNAGYSSTFIAGRGNLTSTTRWEVPNNLTSATSRIRYDIAGSPVAQLDPLNRKIRIEYTDVFNDLQNRNSFAYPTKVYDPANSFSEVKYRFDIGANVRAQSPAPQGQSQGKITERIFDSIGRLQKDLIFNHGGAYTRYEYPTNGIQSKVFSTIIDTNGNNTGDTADEVLSERFFDGAGRVTHTRTPHTFSGGSTTTYAGTHTVYDILGRVTGQSVPTEVNASWSATGDDATRGWIYNYADYDWMSRTTRNIPSDSNGTDGKDTLITYAGCGCAGGLVTTVKGPVTTAVDAAGNLQTTKRRWQKSHADILGRTYKTESWDLDGAGTAPYNTVKTTFNGRDQATLIREYVGGDTSTTYQDTTATFDGHGRLATSHKPEQRDENDNLKYTQYSYNADDSIQSVTDGRGAVTNYTYENASGVPKRPLVTGISWTVPNGTINDPADVSFVYDNAGNRISMTDGMGSMGYTYDSMSRMTSELREFNDDIWRAPSPNSGYNLQYTYGLSGQLKSITDPYSDSIFYEYDKAGRLSEVNGSSFGNQTEYATGVQYRAWGGLKSLAYGNNLIMNQTFNNRLQPATYDLTGAINPTMQKNYEYYNDGSLKYVDDENSHSFDRLNVYDHQGRIKDAKTGYEANGGPGQGSVPYRQSYTYNAFGNLTARSSLQWGQTSYGGRNYGHSSAYQNNRVTDGTWSYDADGRNIYSTWPGTAFGSTSSSYDAAGRMVGHYGSDAGVNVARSYDGDGNEVKSFTEEMHDDGSVVNWKYYIRSTVLGGVVVSETHYAGNKAKTFVYAAGTVIADQEQSDNSQTTSPPWKHVFFKNWDAAGMSFRYTFSEAAGMHDASYLKSELDPIGNNVGEGPPPPPTPTYNLPRDLARAQPREADFGLFISGMPTTCTQDGMEMPCTIVMRSLRNGISTQCPNNDCGAQVAENRRTGQRVVTMPFSSYADGRSGYRVPIWQDNQVTTYDDNGPHTTNYPPEIIGWSWVDARPELSTNCNDRVLVEVQVSDSGDGATSKRPYMHRAVVNDFNAALEEIRQGGMLHVGFNEIFRPFAVQKEYWEAYKNNGFKAVGNILKAANTDKNPYPGPSNHGAGFSFDIMLRNRGFKDKPYDPHYARKLTQGPNRGQTVEAIFNKHGFYRNEPNDEPHFNYKRKPTYAEKLAAQNYFRDCLGDKY